MDTLIDLIPYAITFAVAYAIGEQVRTIKFMLNISKNPDQFIEMLNKIKDINEEVEVHGMPEDAIPLTLEEVNGQVFAYNKITGEFLAQAQNMHQAISLATARFPNKKFWHPSLKEFNQTA